MSADMRGDMRGEVTPESRERALVDTLESGTNLKSDDSLKPSDSLESGGKSC